MIFFAIKPTQVLGVVPNGKKYLFSQMNDSKFPILESFPIKLTVATINVLLKAPINLIFVTRNNTNCPDSVMVRAFASEAGGAGSNPGRVIPKTLKMVPVAALLGAQH